MIFNPGNDMSAVPALNLHKIDEKLSESLDDDCNFSPTFFIT